MNNIPKIGDTVQIRQWDDMAAEYGISSGGYIYPEYESDMSGRDVPFNRAMKSLCGQTFIVEDVIGYVLYGHMTQWTITSKMVELIDDNVANSSELNNFLKLFGGR